MLQHKIMEEYEIFQKRGMLDFEKSKLCFEKLDFELSSYLMQQSLEKTIKAYLLKKKVIVNPEELGHLPLSKIFDLLQDNIKDIQRNYQDEEYLSNAFRQTINNMEQLSKMFKEVVKQPKKSKLKIPIWKESLGISLKDNEKQAFEEELKGMQFTATPEIDILRNYASHISDEQYKMIEENLRINKNQIKSLISKLPEIKKIEDIKNLDPSLQKQFIHIGLELIKTSEVSSNQTFQNQYNSSMLEQLLEIILLKDIILKVTVHEDIGRYPIIIDDKVSTDWYAEKQDQLMNLLNTVEMVNADLNNKMEKMDN